MQLKSQHFQPESAGEQGARRAQAPGNPAGKVLNSAKDYAPRSKTGNEGETPYRLEGAKERFPKIRVDKGELRMRRSEYGPLQWSLASTMPGNPARSRRWNMVLIAILAFLVLGVFVVARAPHTGSGAAEATKISLKNNQKPASARAESKEGTLTATHSRGQTANVNHDPRAIITPVESLTQLLAGLRLRCDDI